MVKQMFAWYWWQPLFYFDG